MAADGAVIDEVNSHPASPIEGIAARLGGLLQPSQPSTPRHMLALYQKSKRKLSQLRRHQLMDRHGRTAIWYHELNLRSLYQLQELLWSSTSSEAICTILRQPSSGCRSVTIKVSYSRQRTMKFMRLSTSPTHTTNAAPSRHQPTVHCLVIKKETLLFKQPSQGVRFDLDTIDGFVPIIATYVQGWNRSGWTCYPKLDGLMKALSWKSLKKQPINSKNYGCRSSKL